MTAYENWGRCEGANCPYFSPRCCGNYCAACCLAHHEGWATHAHPMRGQYGVGFRVKDHPELAPARQHVPWCTCPRCKPVVTPEAVGAPTPVNLLKDDSHIFP